MKPSADRKAVNENRLSLGPREARSFHVVLILTLLLISIWLGVIEFPRQAPAGIAGLTILLLIHILLQWLSPSLAQKPRWVLMYILVQCVIIVAIAVISSGNIIAVAFFLALASQALSLLQSRRRSLLAAGGVLLISLITFVVLNGWSNILSWLALAVPMGVFSFFYITMFGLQAQSRAEAQRLLRELETAHAQLAEYAAQVEDLTLTAERERIARELHDTLAQGLAGLILQLEAADSHLSRGGTQVAIQIIQQAMARARATLTEARKAIANLRSGPSSPSELEDAIRTEARRFSDATGIPCHVEVRLPDDLPLSRAEIAQRAVSEGLANIARHAKASRAELSVHASEDWFEIFLRDDGVGFERAEVEARSGHYGLIGLRERARLSGGSLDIRSAPGEGTTVSVRLPLSPESASE